MKDMLKHAYHHGYAVGAFDLVSLDFLQGIMTAAEQARAPVILSLAESHFEYFDFELVMPAVETAAKRASVPVAIHLDHGASLASAVAAINHGCNGVMVDASHEQLSNNIQITRAVVDMAHACGVPVEGELGYVPGVEGEDAERHPGEVAYTTPEEARSYVEQTGVDFLAISIGTVHGRMQGEPKLDFQRLQQINEALDTPLVIHGGTGLSYTALSDAAAKQINENIVTGAGSGYTGLVKNIRAAVAAEAEHCMHLWGAAGRADELLSYCRPWLPVEHLIIYNVHGVDKSDTETMIDEGRRALSAIAGVRAVFAGEAVLNDAKYRYTWLVRFCHPAVVDSYREHPEHVAFANKLFRPVAGERISIDYQTVALGTSHVKHSNTMETMP
jgi:fructose-bisphosphate aldolase class II